LRWLWIFSRHCGHKHLQYTLRVLAPLGHITARLFNQLVTTEGLDCDYRREGYYEVYLTERALAAAEREADLMREHGYNAEKMTGSALQGREPALNDQVLGGLFYPEAATINPYRFVLALAERAGRYGATFEIGREATDIVVSTAGKLQGVRTGENDSITADYVVFAAGAYGGALARKLGCRLPLQAAKGYHLDRDPELGGTPALQQACLLGETSVFCTPMNGFVRFAGTLELSGINHELRQPRLQQLATAATRYFNNMGDASSRSQWCGLRPCLPDGLPAVGPTPKYPNALIATGHAMAGLTLGPVTGQLIAEYILDGTPTAAAQALRPDRF
jgi:D-amino-acid dehydrogenase